MFEDEEENLIDEEDDEVDEEEDLDKDTPADEDEII